MRTVLRGRPLEERFHALTQKGGPDECWLWLGRAERDGYGCIQSGPTEHLAHRLSLEFKLGRKLGPGEVAMHSCDVRRCVNPAHLSAGTIADNNRDAVRKDRHARGERNGHARLLEAQVLAIRQRRAAGERAKDIAAEFGISDRLVYYVCNGQKWKHLAAAEAEQEVAR